MRAIRRLARRAPEPTASITTARPTLREDIDRRASRYLLSMSIRTVCLVLAVVVEGPFRWAFLAGAILLPYVAVVMANAGRERTDLPTTLLDPTSISAGPDSSDDDAR